MTHLTILALGSRGDVYPYAALGQGLQAAGYDVRLISFANFAPLAARYGLDFAAVSGDAEKLLSGGGGVSLAESGQNVWRQWRAVQALFGDVTRGLTAVLSQSEIWRTDGLINQLPGSLYGRDLAEKLGIPLINAAVMPLTRTAAFPMVAFPDSLAGLPGYNSLTYRLAEQIVWSGFRRSVNLWRRETLGLPVQAFGGDFAPLSQLPTLLGFSRYLVPRPADWGANVHLTGYWQPPEPDWEPPAALLAFLADGPPPIFCGFGSMPVRDARQTTALILAAQRLTGQRLILHAGWAGLGTADLPDDVFLLDYAPYSWLFPQMAAVVHHGGAGTTALGAAAGVPSLVVPFLFDQFFWGRRLHALGVAPAPLPFKKLTAHQLAAAWHQLVGDTIMRQRAAALGEKVRGEDGVAAACAVVRGLA